MYLIGFITWDGIDNDYKYNIRYNWRYCDWSGNANISVISYGDARRITSNVEYTI